MAMVSTMHLSPAFKRAFQRLLAAGKPKKTTIIDCIRKMIIKLNSMVRDGVMWDPEMNIN
jgi:transposase